MPSRLKLLSLMALFALPLLAATLLLASGWRPSASRAHGELLSPARPLGALLDERGAPLDWRGAEASWHLIVLGPERCDPRCAETAELLSRVWVALHRDARRLRIRWLGEPDLASRERLARLPGFAAVRLADGSVIAGLDLAPRGELHLGNALPLLLADPDGHLAVLYRPGFDPSGLRRDLARLIR